MFGLKAGITIENTSQNRERQRPARFTLKPMVADPGSDLSRHFRAALVRRKIIIRLFKNLASRSRFVFIFSTQAMCVKRKIFREV